MIRAATVRERSSKVRYNRFLTGAALSCWRENPFLLVRESLLAPRLAGIFSRVLLRGVGIPPDRVRDRNLARAAASRSRRRGEPGSSSLSLAHNSPKRCRPMWFLCPSGAEVISQGRSTCLEHLPFLCNEFAGSKAHRQRCSWAASLYGKS